MDTSACIINELTQGMELAKRLQSVLSSEASAERKQALIEAIILSLERSLVIAKWVDSVTQPAPIVVTQPVLSQPESSVSVDESPRSEDFINQAFDNQLDQKIVSKKRKAMPTWNNQVRCSTDNRLEGNSDDGYCWRKYGQKDILGARFPRSYYRCTYRYVHNCMARKQVQRSDEDPTVFEITYRAQHTCNPAAAPPPPSPEKHEIKQINQQVPPQSRTGEMLSNLRENLRVSTSDLDATVPSSFSFPSASFGSIENYQNFNFSNESDNDFTQGYVPSGLNYFTEWGNDLQHHEDTNLSGMISTTASATNSPLSFPADMQDVSQNFPFNSGFFL